MTSLVVGSILASIALTVLLNLVIRVFPGTSADARAREVFGEYPERSDEMPSSEDSGRVRVFFPWRQMLLWSAGLTIVLNVIALID